MSARIGLTIKSTELRTDCAARNARLLADGWRLL